MGSPKPYSWADWDSRGRLLAATLAGSLRVSEVEGPEPRTAWSFDLDAIEPSRSPAPDWARGW